MAKLKLISDYKSITEYRSGFYELANNVFGINFEKWYEKGGWNDRYICYSYTDGNKVVANVSVNKMDIIRQGKSEKAIQIGTVMTHPEYRGRGLSADLMNIVLEEYEKKYDFIYLFANKSVLSFYPKFGFKQFIETRFSIDIDINKSGSDSMRKLDISAINDFNTIFRLISERRPVSRSLGVKNDFHLLLFHCLYVFYDSLYYLEDEDALAIFKQEKDRLLIYDVITKNEISFWSVLNKISSPDTGKVVFYFMPDFSDLNFTCEPYRENLLFIKPASMDMAKEFIFPVTSHA